MEEYKNRIDTNYTIRLARQDEAPLLAALGAQTFSETFARDNTPQDLAEYLRKNFSPEIQSAELAQPGSLFLILEIDGAPAGYVRLLDHASEACLTESDQWNHLHPMELVRIYLLQAWTDHRLGDVLMKACSDFPNLRKILYPHQPGIFGPLSR